MNSNLEYLAGVYTLYSRV